MQTKLTLRLDDQLVHAAKRHAKQNGCSVSQMVADYFATIAAAEHRPATLAPKVSQLMGALEGTGVDEADYHDYLKRKHL